MPDVEIFMRLHDRNPVQGVGGWEYDFFVDSNGANIVGNYPELDGFFVTYKAIWDGPYTTASATIPQEWFYYVGHATYADFLRMDGQVDKAMAEEAVAQMYLDTELTKASQQRNMNNLFRRISTYTSRQSISTPSRLAKPISASRLAPQSFRLMRIGPLPRPSTFWSMCRRTT
jgi:hypothetical protein